MRETIWINKHEVIVLGMEWIIFGAKGRGETNQRCKVPGSSHLAKHAVCVCVHACVHVHTCAHAHVFSRVQFYAISWTVAHWALLPMEFSRQEYWCGLLFPSPGDLPNPEIEPKFPVSPAFQADSLPLAQPGKLNRCDLNFWDAYTTSRKTNNILLWDRAKVSIKKVPLSNGSKWGHSITGVC